MVSTSKLDHISSSGRATSVPPLPKTIVPSISILHLRLTFSSAATSQRLALPLHYRRSALILLFSYFARICSRPGYSAGRELATGSGQLQHRQVNNTNGSTKLTLALNLLRLLSLLFLLSSPPPTHHLLPLLLSPPIPPPELHLHVDWPCPAFRMYISSTQGLLTSSLRHHHHHALGLSRAE